MHSSTNNHAKRNDALSTFSRTSPAPVPERRQGDDARDAVPLPPGLRLADAVRRAQYNR